MNRGQTIPYIVLGTAKGVLKTELIRESALAG
jgi:hypothetical protein